MKDYFYDIFILSPVVYSNPKIYEVVDAHKTVHCLTKTRGFISKINLLKLNKLKKVY